MTARYQHELKTNYQKVSTQMNLKNIVSLFKPFCLPGFDSASIEIQKTIIYIRFKNHR